LVPGYPKGPPVVSRAGHTDSPSMKGRNRRMQLGHAESCSKSRQSLSKRDLTRKKENTLSY
jgi:hypothetical protein